VVIPNMNNRLSPAASPRPFILVVDGDADSRELYRELFTAEGYVVETCDDGAEALGVAICRTPDLIVMETHIRRIDGFALCQLLRKDVATRLVPIVVVTATTTGGESARAKAAGADLVFAKPLKLEEVIEKVQQLLERSSGSAQPPVTSATSLQPRTLAPAANNRRESRSVVRSRTTTPPAAPPAASLPSVRRGTSF
jgi:DNA-binding response OmpR family regulator